MFSQIKINLPIILLTLALVVLPIAAQHNGPQDNDGFETSQTSDELALSVAENINLKLCITQSNVKINGWNRSELRIFTDEDEIAYKILEKNAESGKPVWVMVTGGAGSRGDCITDSDVNIDVPVNATIDIQGREGNIRIDSVKKAVIKNVGGRLSVKNVSGGISAGTYEGDIVAEDISGSISLETSIGNILVNGVKAGQVGDTFNLKTSNGTISLANVEHRQITATSISGSINFDGSFLNSGVYRFNTMFGGISLTLPGDSSCKITSTYGSGTFVSDFGQTSFGSSAKPRSTETVIGSGDAAVNVMSNSGSIRLIKKQN